MSPAAVLASLLIVGAPASVAASPAALLQSDIGPSEGHEHRAGAPLEQADTTFALERGRALALQNLSGRVSVEAWDRAEVRIEMDTPEEGGVRISSSGRNVEVRPGQRHEHGRGRYFVSAPEWAELEIRGSELEVTIQGMKGGVEVRTGEGDVELRDVEGPVAARSVEGMVRIVNATGPVAAYSGDDDVVLRNVRGPVVAQTVDGDITLENVDAPDLEATVVDGDVRFSGPLARDGEYRLGTHDGDLIMEMDADVDANVVVSTFDGEFESEFLVTMDRFEGGKALRFTLGQGGAQVYLEVFDGDIQLRRR